jgi:hypothetical protein
MTGMSERERGALVQQYVEWMKGRNWRLLRLGV